MSLVHLLSLWLWWQSPQPAYGPRPLVLPTAAASGQELLYVRENWQGDEIWARSLDNGEQRQVWAAAPLAVEQIQWAGSAHALIRARLPARAPALWWLDLESGQPHPLTPVDWPEGERRGASVVSLGAAGDLLFTLDRRRPYQPDLYRWSPERRQPRVAEVNPGDVLGWRSDAAGTPRLRQRFRPLPDNVQYIWEWRQQAYGEWTRLDAWRLEEPGWRPLRFVSTDDLWVSAESDQRATYGLHRLTLLAAQLSAPTVSSLAADIDRVWWSASDQQPALVEWHSLLPGQRALLPQWRQWQQQLQQRDADAHWLLRDVREASAEMLVTRVRSSQPQDWWWYRAADDELLTLGPEWPVLPAIPELEALRWISADGLPLHAYYQPPVRSSVDHAATDAPAPLLVLVHGGPWSRDRYGYDPLVAALARQGIGVLKVNFRGSSGAGREFLLASRGQWGKAMQADLLAGIEQLNRRGWVDPQRVCIAGMSYGGYAALQAILTESDRFRCAMAHAPVTDLEQHIRWLAQRGDRLGAAEWRALVGSPDTQLEALQSVSPLHHAGQLQRPLLLSHGEDDGVVAVSHSHRFLRAAAARHQWLHWLPLEGGHQLQNASQRQRLWRRWQQFLSAYLLSE
ncbi:MAG: hypothetical protein Tsb002_08320 [Wenzhouxiangellaceae bacterium]